MTGPHDVHDTHDTHDRLERLLLEDAQRWRDGFTPPSLDGALARAHLDAAGGDPAQSSGAPTTSSADRTHSEASARPGGRSRRATWPVPTRALAVAAAVLVLVGGVVSLVRTLPRSSSNTSTVGSSVAGATRSGPTPGVVTDVPQTWTVDGRVLPYRVSDPVTSAQVTDRSSSILQIAVAEGSGDFCHPLNVPLLTGDDAESVEVTVASYASPAPSAPPGTGNACPAMSGRGTLKALDLGAPLGSRRVIDASSGQAVSVILESTVPNFTVPSGYVAGPISPAFREDPVFNGPTRSWTKGSQQLDFDSLDPALVHRSPDVVVLLTGTVDGHPAEVTTIRQLDSPFQVRWQPDSTHLWRLSNTGSPRPELTPQQLLAIAQTVTVRR